MDEGCTDKGLTKEVDIKRRRAHGFSPEWGHTGRACDTPVGYDSRASQTCRMPRE